LTLPLRAQQATKVHRIGYLGVTSHAEYAREIEALLRGLSGTRKEKILQSIINSRVTFSAPVHFVPD
jgi:hypothetical protein